MQSDSGYTSEVFARGQGTERPGEPITLDFALSEPANISDLVLYCRTGLQSVTEGLCPQLPRLNSIQVSNNSKRN